LRSLVNCWVMVGVTARVPEVNACNVAPAVGAASMVCPELVWVVTVNEPVVPGCPATQVAGNTMAFAPAARSPLVVQVIVLLVHTAGQPVFTAVGPTQPENDATGVGTEVR